MRLKLRLRPQTVNMLPKRHISAESIQHLWWIWWEKELLRLRDVQRGEVTFILDALRRIGRAAPRGPLSICASDVRQPLPPRTVMTNSPPSILGEWSAAGGSLAIDGETIAVAVQDIAAPLVIVNTTQGPALGRGGSATIGRRSGDATVFPITGFVPPSTFAQLGDQTFRDDHGLRYSYVSGAMAAGIGSVEIVEEMARHGMLGFFGAA